MQLSTTLTILTRAPGGGINKRDGGDAVDDPHFVVTDNHPDEQTGSLPVSLTVTDSPTGGNGSATATPAPCSRGSPPVRPKLE
jgi:hypothetical protein